MKIHGGIRTGAGRKKMNYKSILIQFKVHPDLVLILKKEIRHLIKIKSNILKNKKR